jgi:hypothetical protein
MKLSRYEIENTDISQIIEEATREFKLANCTAIGIVLEDYSHLDYCYFEVDQRGIFEYSIVTQDDNCIKGGVCISNGLRFTDVVINILSRLSIMNELEAQK